MLIAHTVHGYSVWPQVRNCVLLVYVMREFKTHDVMGNLGMILRAQLMKCENSEELQCIQST